MITVVKKISDWLDIFSIRIATVMVAIILLLTIVGAVSRYIFNNPLPWPLPVAQILMIWSALLGIPAALKRGEHMGVEALFSLLPAKAETILRYFDYLLILMFTGVLFWFGWLELQSNTDIYMITRSIKISSRWLVAAIPVSALIQIIHILTVPYLIEEAKDRYSDYIK